MKKSSKNRLTLKQEHLFPSDTLFGKIARTACRAGTLPRKELYEAWETARRVRRRYRGGRILDLACGHGLLAHILMILDNTSDSAIAVDRHIPKNARRLSQIFMDSWPRLKGRVEYRQMDIDDVRVKSTDLVVSAHACGALTDRIIEKAMEKSARVAVLPCCHNTKSCSTADLDGWMDSALAIDTARAFRLKQAGYTIVTQKIPHSITPKHRLLMGEFTHPDSS